MKNDSLEDEFHEETGKLTVEKIEFLHNCFVPEDFSHEIRGL